MLLPTLKRLLIAALLLSSVDAVITRTSFPHRPATPQLLLEGWALWLVPTLAAALVAGLASTRLRWLRETRGDDEQSGPLRYWVLLALAATPVLMHSGLDRYTSIGGNLSGLKTATPWIAAFGSAAVGLVLAAIVDLVATRAPRGASLAALGAVTLAGAFLPPGGDAAPPADAADARGRPNLLLMVWDTSRAESFSFLGGERSTTPALERLAEQSLVFENARSVTHFTFTSHLSMLTGRYPTEHGARLLNPRHDAAISGNTLAEDLSQAGYRTGGFVGTGVLRARTGIASGFERYSDVVDPPVTDTYLWALIHDLQSIFLKQGRPGWNNGEPHWIQDYQRPADSVLDEALAWIEEDDERPWFCFVNLFDVHWPYEPTTESVKRFAPEYAGVIDGYSQRSNTFPDDYELDAQDDAYLLSLYESEFLDLDRKVDAFLKSLDLDTSNTAVLITADHGECFGEGGEYGHEDILEPQVRVPFVLRLPGAEPRAERRDEPVSGIDVAPTLRGLAGLERRKDQILGVDLVNDLLPQERIVFVEDRDHHDSEKVQFAAYSGRFKLVWKDALYSETFELYDLEADPIGSIDVSDQHPDLFADLVQRLRGSRSWLPLDAVEAGVGETNEDALRALGYLGD